MSILKINSSVQTDRSVSRRLVEQLVNQIQQPGEQVVERDLAKGLPLLTQEMVAAFYTPADQRTVAQKASIVASETLVQELQTADVLVLGVPIYNFSVPASVKAYFDLVARVGLTFRYTEDGPIGLLKNKKAYVVIASGGTAFRSEIDFASDYIKQFLGFIGIEEVHFIPADQLMFGADAVVAKAQSLIQALPSGASVPV
ncbi:MAG: NAD(P)H-dependent oxidoreductase [Bacteroidota bacterium]